MTDINRFGAAPYQLINATVNLPSSIAPVLKDRKGDFFVFSKYWSGSRATGYYKTDHWKVDGGHVTLATAMAVSGAAASPHMGLGSKPTLAALMTFSEHPSGDLASAPSRGASQVTPDSPAS